MIDSLFGSKTRVKLLYLFLNSPDEKYYVREITRKIEEQINSVRRELSNMLSVGVIVSDSSDNKLYYQANKRYEFYAPLRGIFANIAITSEHQAALVDQAQAPSQQKSLDLASLLSEMSGLRLALASGKLVAGSKSIVDLLIVGSVSNLKTKEIIKKIEVSVGKELDYTVMAYDEFYYRLSVRDKFITDIISQKYIKIIDTDNVLGIK
jgi:hypothetical protein